MVFTDKYVESYFRRLGKSEAYARAQWEWLKGQGPHPKPEDFGVPLHMAETVGIKLAAHHRESQICGIGPPYTCGAGRTS